MPYHDESANFDGTGIDSAPILEQAFEAVRTFADESSTSRGTAEANSHCCCQACMNYSKLAISLTVQLRIRSG